MIEEIKPVSLNDDEKYGLLGKTRGFNARAIVSTVIANSRDGKWTTFDDLDHVCSPHARMNEVLSDGRFRIYRREVKFTDSMGRKNRRPEFCIV